MTYHRPLSPSSRRRFVARRGFTLVEILTVLSLMIAGLMMVSAFFGFGVRSVRASRRLTAATILAAEETERLRTIPYDSLPLGARSYSRTAAGIPLLVSSQVQDSLPRLRTIVVSVGDPQTGKELQRFSTAHFKYTVQ